MVIFSDCFVIWKGFISLLIINNKDGDDDIVLENLKM